MVGWQEWKGKKVFIRLKTGKVFSGKVVDVDVQGQITFLTIIDKFNKKVSMVISEVLEIKEEG